MSQCGQSKGIQLKLRGHTLRSGAYWKGAFKKSIKQAIHASLTFSSSK